MNEYTEKSDPTLVDLTLLGNSSAFEELVIRHQKKVLGTAYRITSNRWSAEDAAQDAFVSAWTHLSALNDKDHFGSWVCAIAKNHACRIMRDYAAAIDLSLELPDGVEPVDPTCENGEVREAVDSLSEVLRETVKLHYFGGYKLEEIAKMLDVPVGTIKWRLSEARKQLRKGYGVMDKNYDENESLTSRVMRQVEELKLWRLKDDRSGFEADYRKVLGAVEALPESEKKQHALADVLLCGYWWLKKDDEVIARMRSAAEKSHNEDVMQALVSSELFAIKDEKARIEYSLEKLIPRLEAEDWKRLLGFVWFWLGLDYERLGERQKMFDAFQKVTEILDRTDVYYANALSAIKVEQRIGDEKDDLVQFNTTGEQLKEIDGKLWFWTQPGFGSGQLKPAVLWSCSQFDRLVLDPGMKVGETRTSSDGRVLKFLSRDERIATPAGVFENCAHFSYKGRGSLTSCDTWFCEGVGIVAQKWTRNHDSHCCLLSEYKACGDGLLPLGVGNHWCYRLSDENRILDDETHYEVIYNDKSTINLAVWSYVKTIGYADNWSGNLLRARENYWHGDALDRSALEFMARAEAMAETGLQKLHTSIATDVMRRIMETSCDTNPDCKEIGRWNFFDIERIYRKDGRVLFDTERKYAFEWKICNPWSEEANKILYSFIYQILSDDLGCLWSDEWIPGYRYENGEGGISICVDDAEIETPAGKSDCRHVSFSFRPKDQRHTYFMGDFELWYAEGIGLVQFAHCSKTQTVWQLTAFSGIGEGFFPVADKLFRRYEPTELGEGFRASVEFTYSADEDGILIFKNALGVQSRKEFDLMTGR